MTGRTPARPALQVFVAPGCAGCRTALKIVDAVRRAQPAQVVDVVDLADKPDMRLPAGVIGTPTYLPNDRVISMGNRDLDELLEQLDSAAGSVDDD